MRHPKRHVLSLLALSVSLFSCASFAATKLTLVEVITSPARTEMLQKMLTAYKTLDPDIEIEVVSLPWGQAFEKLGTMIQSGQYPDVVEMPDTWQGLYASNGMLVDLEPQLKQWRNTAD